MGFTTKEKVYGGLALTAILAAGGLYWRHKTKAKRETEQYYDPRKQLPVGTINALEKAATLAHHLGYAYGAMDPRRWTENDQEVYETLLTIPESAFRGVEKEYNQKYGRNLRTDLKSTLDPSLYAKIKYLS